MKKTVFFVLFFLISSFLFANEKKFTFEIEPLLEIRNGKIGEYVFFNKFAYNTDKLSYLEWELSPNIIYGLNVNANYKDLVFSCGVAAAIPMSSGNLFDSDWLNIESYGNEDRLYKTNFSIHENQLNYNYSIHFDLGYNFTHNNFATFTPFVSFGYETYQFTGIDGHGQYGNSKGSFYYPYNDDINSYKVQFSGPVIKYNRKQFDLWIGNKVSFLFSKRFAFGGLSKIALFSSAQAIDKHLLTSYDFLDLPKDIFSGYNLEVYASLLISKKQNINIKAGYLFTKPIRGINYQKESSEDEFSLSAVEGGTDSNYVYLTLSYKLLF